MPFQHGKDAKVYISGYDLTSYFNSFSAASTGDQAETSTFGSTYKSYVGGLIDSSASGEGYFDSAATGIDAILSAALAGDTYICFLPAGDARGKRGRALYGVETTYDISTAVDGVGSVSFEAQSKAGAEPLVSNHAYGTETTTGSESTGVDGAAASTAGWSAFIQVMSFAGTATPTITLRLQDSPDGSTDWQDVSGGAFTARTTVGAQRISGTGTLRRWTKFAWVISGTNPIIGFFAGHVRK